ncbi:nicotinamide riboside transporter PnuC [Salidesulfovibrio brasiliensis]|uniref:nicotinamide riboside transporter PnuC n=1 Tax=Salidesulfovibrio brasiliensis TaxID=221711 RepID=UPI0006CF25F2|nr:nicotinamide riboside transporter PnuC [Salidesulfovibrio brasiliensis]
MMEIFTEAYGFIVAFVQGMGWAERLSTLTGLIYIVLSVRQNPLCWPFGIISVGIWMVVVFMGKLYSDAFLQFVYVVLGFYGWYQWLKGGEDKTPLEVRRVERPLGMKLALTIVVATVPVWLLTKYVLDAAYPFWDALTTVVSLVAQYLLAKKYLENWILWIIADIIYIFIYHLKGWNGYAVLMAVYTTMAVLGYLAWRKSMQPRKV